MLQKSQNRRFICTLTRKSSMKMWILLHILAYFFNINVILGNLLETFEIFTNHLFCQRSGCAGCIVTPRRSLPYSTTHSSPLHQGTSQRSWKVGALTQNRSFYVRWQAKVPQISLSTRKMKLLQYQKSLQKSRFPRICFPSGDNDLYFNSTFVCKIVKVSVQDQLSLHKLCFGILPCTLETLTLGITAIYVKWHFSVKTKWVNFLSRENFLSNHN